MTRCAGQHTTAWTRVTFGVSPLYSVHPLCVDCVRYTSLPDSKAMASPMREGECGERVVEEVVS